MLWEGLNFPAWVWGCLILTGSAVLDYVLGDPQNWLHPVQCIGWAIAKGSGFILQRWPGPRARRGGGDFFRVRDNFRQWFFSLGCGANHAANFVVVGDRRANYRGGQLFGRAEFGPGGAIGSLAPTKPGFSLSPSGLG